MPQPCFFYIDYSEGASKGRIWPLCLECGQKRQNAWYWDKDYGVWEIRCHNPNCSKLIWDGKNENCHRPIDPC